MASFRALRGTLSSLVSLISNIIKVIYQEEFYFFMGMGIGIPCITYYGVGMSWYRVIHVSPSSRMMYFGAD